MFSRIKYLLPFALAGAVALTSTGSLFAQIRATTGGGPTGGSPSSTSTGSSTGSSSSSLGSFGLPQSNFSLGGTNTGSSSSSLSGNSPGSSSRGGSTTSYGSTSLRGPYLAEPLAAGLPSNNTTGTTTTKAFGSALYTITTSTGNNAGGNRAGSNFGNTGTGNINRSTTAGTASTFNPNGAFRVNAPAYTTRIAFPTTAPAMPAVRAELVRIIGEASDLPSRSAVSVVMDGNTVVLQGKVATGEERRVFESLVRLAPGVNVVRNELVALRPGDE